MSNFTSINPLFNLEFQIKYKFAWKDESIKELSKKDTKNKSRTYSVCGSLTRIEHGGILHCDKCGLTIDKDINASY
ncbi:MAG: zinc ribbon domain-containing protein [Thermoplasmata archaeon]